MPRTLGTPIPLFLAAERSIEPVEDAEPFVHGSAGGERTESRLGVVLRHGDGAQLFHQLVDAHGALSREQLHPGVRILGEADGQCRHGSLLGNQGSGPDDAQLREAQLGSFEIARVVCDDGLRISGNRQLDKVIVCLIGQIRSP